MTVLARARVVIEGDTVQLTRSLQGAGRAMKQMGDKASRIGRNLSLRVTAPIVGVGAAAAKMGSDFEAEMSKIVGLVGVAQDQVDAWGRDILDMAPRLGAAPRELAEGLFFVTSAGLRGAAAMEVLEASAKASAAGLGEIRTIADLSTSAMNAYGQEVLSAVDATDILTAAVREGKIEPEQLAGAMGQVIPVAANMGIRFDEVGAAMAAMSRTGTNASVAATQLRQIMVSLLKPSEQAQTALEEMGLSAAELRQQVRDKGLLSVLQTLAQRFEGNDNAAAQVFGNIRALSGIMDLMGESADATADIFASLENATGSLDHAFETASETARFRMAQSLATLQTILVRLGDQILPTVATAFEALTRNLQRAADLFLGMPGWLRTAALGFVALAAAIPPVLMGLGALVKMAGLAGTAMVAMKVPAMITAFTGWAQAVWGLIPAVKGLSGAIALLKVAIGPAGWLLLGLGALAGVLALVARRFRSTGEEARLAAERIDGYKAALAGWTQEAKKAEQARLEEALERQRKALERQKELVEGLGRAIAGAERERMPGGVRLALVEEEQKLRKELEAQSQLVQRLEEDYRAVSAAVREGAAAHSDVQSEIDAIMNAMGGLSAGAPDAVREALDQLKEDLHTAARQSEVLGDAFDLGQARATAFRAAVDALAASSVGLDTAIGDNGETVRDLAEEWLGLEAANLSAAEAARKARVEQESIDAATEGLRTGLAENARLALALGEAFDQTAADADTYGRAVRTLVALGVDLDAVVGPRGETLGELADTYLDLAAGIDATNRMEAEAARIREEHMDPLTRYEETVARLNEILEANPDMQDEVNRALEAAALRYRDATGEVSLLGDALVHTAARGLDAFVGFATGAGTSIRQFVQRAMTDLARLIARMLVARALLSAFPGVGLAVSLAGALDPTARRHGGPVRRGELYIAGEEGPELIAVDGPGHVFNARDTDRMFAGSTANPVPAVAASGSGRGGRGRGAGEDGLPSMTINVPPAKDPITFARDGQWVHALGEGVLEWWERGGRFPDE